MYVEYGGCVKYCGDGQLFVYCLFGVGGDVQYKGGV